jgi:thioredoxin 1
MPSFDAPITTDDNNLKKVLAQNLPIVLVLFDSRTGADKPLEDTLSKAAKKHAGDLLVVRVDVAHSPRAFEEYGCPQTPAIITLGNKGMLSGRKAKSQASRVRPADVRAHIDYLLDKGPEPGADAPKSASPSGKHSTKHVTDATFKNEVLKSQVPVLVDFWAPWCGPCLSVAPLIEQIAQEFAGKVKVVKLNTDENPTISRQFQVMSIPTFIVFRNGQAVERRVGANPRAIREMVQEASLH